MCFLQHKSASFSDGVYAPEIGYWIHARIGCLNNGHFEGKEDVDEIFLAPKTSFRRANISVRDLT
jgi:hypothetical protein